ncbi:hypothetical protein PFISCL1PPCAC_12970, partial [Pristionchus fissidentatus]
MHGTDSARSRNRNAHASRGLLSNNVLDQWSIRWAEMEADFRHWSNGGNYDQRLWIHDVCGLPNCLAHEAEQRESKRTHTCPAEAAAASACISNYSSSGDCLLSSTHLHFQSLLRLFPPHYVLSHPDLLWFPSLSGRMRAHLDHQGVP